MGHWEVEHGSVLLPSAAVADVKKALRDVHNAHAEKVYEHAKTFWKQHGTQSREKYREAVDAYVNSLTPRRPSMTSYGYGGVSDEDAAIAGSVRTVLHDIDTRSAYEGRNLRGVTWDDMASSRLGKKTNRDTTFHTLGEGHASVAFNDRTVTWHTDEYKNQVERFHADPIGKALMRSLNRVEWTRGTGGVSRTDNELSAEARQMYGGSVGVASWWGPRGAQEYKHEHGFWPHGSPQAKVEEAKRRERDRKKAQRKSAPKTKATVAGGASFCGAMKADKSGLCGRKLAGGKCPDHGVSAKAAVVAGAGATAAGGAAASADPLG